MTAYLEPGDQVHLVWPSTGNQIKDELVLADLRESYTLLGVNIAIATVIGRFDPAGQTPSPQQTEPRVLAVFRKQKESRA